MPDKFQNKYRIPSARLQTWDYGSNGLYFITICTQNREHYFGEIQNGKMILSEIGILANKYWNEIPEHFPFVILDAFVVMPNHVHGIIIIDKPDNDGPNVETQNFASLPSQPSKISTNKFGPQSKNLASIIRGFKIGVTKNARLIHADFAWQSRFYDHIIRNNESYDKIRNYIANNPLKWEEDKFFQKEF
jgi:REP element-mobilizing transposase RayT